MHVIYINHEIYFQCDSLKKRLHILFFIILLIGVYHEVGTYVSILYILLDLDQSKFTPFHKWGEFVVLRSVRFDYFYQHDKCGEFAEFFRVNSFSCKWSELVVKTQDGIIFISITEERYIQHYRPLLTEISLFLLLSKVSWSLRTKTIHQDFIVFHK